MGHIEETLSPAYCGKASGRMAQSQLMLLCYCPCLNWFIFLLKCKWWHIRNMQVRSTGRSRGLNQSWLWPLAKLMLKREYCVPLTCSIKPNQPGDLLAWASCIPYMPDMLGFVTAVSREQRHSARLGKWKGGTGGAGLIRLSLACERGLSQPKSHNIIMQKSSTWPLSGLHVDAWKE